MRSIFLLFFVVISSISIVHGEQCKQGYAKDKADMLADDWLGLKCDPLDEKSLSDNNLKSPCECLKKGEKWGRIKEAIFKHNRDKRSDSIQALLEKKVADVIRSQIDNGFDQSLRMDTLLKQGGVDIYADGTKSSFPKNCRASKIGEVIAALKKGECNKEVYDKRLKAFLGDSKNIDEYLEKRKTVYSNAAMNTLSNKDRAKGMCIPYKTFQSLNNQNPLRKTYLSLARAYSIPSSCPKNVSNCDQYIKDESFKAFKKFQDWASSRKDGYNSLYIPNQTATGSVNGERPGLLRRITEEATQAMDTKNGIESIDREGVLHLIKTDPVFERMIKDPEFYIKVSTGAFGGPDNFKESDPELINSMMRSQDKQCQKLYGTSVTPKDTPPASDRASQRAGVNTKSVDKINSASEKNILTQFLCNEDFPKKFISKDSIRNILAPELKREANINGIKHTEAMVTKWAYCSEDDVKEGKDGSFEIVFGGEETGKDGELQPLSKFLNLSLNPKSDLESSESSADNEYEKFNNEICKSVDDKCKNPNPSYIDFDCSTSNIAKNVTLKMLSSTFGAERAAELNKKFNDPNVSDKELRQEMIGQRTLGEDKTLVDKATTLILLRNQSVQAKSMRATADLKAALGIPKEKNIDDYFKENGGRAAVLEKVSQNIKERVTGAQSGYPQDSVYGEDIHDSRASYFTNYYALADKGVEQAVSDGIKNNSNPSSGAGRDGVSISGSSGPASTRNGGDGGTINNGQVATGNSPIYQRRSFESPDATPLPGTPATPVPPKTPSPPPKRDITDTKTPDTPKVVPEKTPKAALTPANSDSQRAVSGNASNSNFNFTLSQGGGNPSGGNVGGGGSHANKDNNESDYEKQKRDLEDQINETQKKIDDIKKSQNEAGTKDDSEFEKEKKRLTDEINRLERNKNSNHNNSNIGNNNRNNNDTPRNNNNGGNDTPWNNNNSFNNGYGRGEEFDKEKAMKKLDDGSAAFDPEKASKEKMANDSAEGKGEKGGGGSGSSGKGKGAGGKGSSGAVSLSESGGNDTDGEDGVAGGAGGRNRKRRAASESDVIAKCGTDPILKCIFPNSYFVDTKIKDRLYTTIYNLKLEGRQFQGLEKVRRSKRVTKTQYYLYTYDLVAKEKGKLRQANNDERAMIFNEIKQNRNDRAFKKQLEIYRHMTMVVPPKILLGDKEAIDAVNRSITKEEYEALQQ